MKISEELANETTQRNLTREQKEAVGLLSIGTFLEYFDLMLFVHMAVILNELFFPKHDPYISSLLASFAFFTTYLMRPIGALIFGYIGDNIGRKYTVIITTFLMALSSLTMFFLPTYAQIGITASWLVTICRMIQGMSSMGEIIGAVLYLTESIKEPKNYVPVALIRVLPALSTFAALGVAAISIKYGLNWRIAFLVGALVALVGSVARSALRETPDFVDAKKRLIIGKTKIRHPKIDKKLAFSYFFLECTWPLWVYIVYIYCANALKNDFSYSASEIIEHNLKISLAGLLSCFVVIYFTKRIHPIQIMKFIISIFILFFPPIIYLLASDYSIINIVILQYFMIIFTPTTVPGDPVILKHFPILKRFLTTSMLYAISRIVIYFFTSFGTLYFTQRFGVYGLLIIIIPTVIAYLYGLNTFIQLEKEVGNYPKKTSWNIVYLDN